MAMRGSGCAADAATNRKKQLHGIDVGRRVSGGTDHPHIPALARRAAQGRTGKEISAPLH
jgi:hypothetical protein